MATVTAVAPVVAMMVIVVVVAAVTIVLGIVVVVAAVMARALAGAGIARIAQRAAPVVGSSTVILPEIGGAACICSGVTKTSFTYDA